MTGRRTVFSLLFLLCSPLAAHTQELHTLSPSTPASSPAPQNRIALNTVVVDAGGTPVGGLSQRDFTVTVDALPQPVAQFAAPGAPAQPTEAVLVVDAVNTGFNTVSYVRNQVDQFLRGNEGRLPLPVSVAVLTNEGISVLNSPARDGSAVAAVLDGKQTGLRVLRRSSGFYGASERLGISLQGLESLAAYERGRPGRKLVVWISPGWAYFSGLNVYLSQANQSSLFRTVIDLSTALREAGITLSSLYPLGTADAASTRTTYYRTFLKPVRQPAQVLPGNLSLHVLAANSGGRVLFGSNGIAGEVAQCLGGSERLVYPGHPARAGRGWS